MNYLLLVFCFFTFNSIAQSKVDLQKIKTICIDAGHGGKDPGCHGGSSNEKTVCLNIALKLGAKIKENYPNINVIYTRDKDVFVELDDRASFANKNKADLFICIHANSASASAFGSETYALGLHKTAAQQKVADRENSTILLEDDKGEKYKLDEMTADAIIIRQLQMATFLDQSILFASLLQKEFKKIGRYDRGVKQAGFLVLWKTTMPGVLIETGFLTNAEEEKFLANKENQEKMASSMFDAFKKYKNQLEGITDDADLKTEAVKEKTLETVSLENKETVEVKNPSAIYFMVQIETSDTKISLTSSRFKGMDVFEYKQDSFYKYAVGKFENDFNAANSYKVEMREKGFQHAFVIAFQNGERINLDKALKEAKK
ncbi:MAG: N-acetylmuramoyl-L-alanine amidase [Bacteroidota bacterium]